jgi:hypothetical protein
METSQLIGAIKLLASMKGKPVTEQFAVQVKRRWEEKILVKMGYLTTAPGNRFKHNEKYMIVHERDAFKH